MLLAQCFADDGSGELIEDRQSAGGIAGQTQAGLTIDQAEDGGLARLQVHAVKYQLPDLLQNLIDHVAGPGGGAAAHQDHIALLGHLLQPLCHLRSLVRENAVWNSGGSALLHTSSYGIGVDVIDLAWAQAVAGRHELAPGGGHSYLEVLYRTVSWPRAARTPISREAIFVPGKSTTSPKEMSLPAFCTFSPL